MGSCIDQNPKLLTRYRLEVMQIEEDPMAAWVLKESSRTVEIREYVLVFRVYGFGIYHGLVL